MSRRSVVYLNLIIFFWGIYVNGKDFCGNHKTYEEPKGRIETNDERGVIENCTWFIKTPKRSVIYIKIENLQLGMYNDNWDTERNCLNMETSDKNQNYLKFCNDTNYSKVVSLPTNNLLIHLEITTKSYLALTFTSYLVNCTYEALMCSNSRFFPRKPEEICFDGMLVCDAFCKSRAASCGEFCYDVFQQRCDGILDCLNGEDELGCNPTLCPNNIQCINDTKCVEPMQICDNQIDCKHGFDESHCSKSFCDDTEASCYVNRNLDKQLKKDESSYVFIIIMVVLAILFMCMISKCLASRQNVRNLLDNPLDIPLPPFRGPGEGTSATEEHPFTEEDFKPGGEIYESFAQNMDKIKSKRKNMLEIEDNDITFVKPPPGKSLLDKYFNGVKPVLSEEFAALATIKITRDMCYGLKKSKSEELPMTRLLFIDNKDDDISDDSDTGNNAGCSNWRDTWRDQRKKVYPKSDTNVRRKNVEITIV